MKKHYKSLAIWLRGAAMAIILCNITTVVRAGLLETQSNPVPTAFNPYTLGSWGGIPQYSTEPTGDATAEGYDWFYTQIAHNDDWFFIHYYNSTNFAGDRQLMYFDTDTNRATGLPGFTGNLAVGADFYLSGAALNTGSGTFLGYIGWNNTQDGSGAWDIFIAINRAQLMPGVTNFNFVNQNHGSATDDWYPNAGNSGAGGDFFSYSAPPATLGTVTFSGRTWTTLNQTTLPPASGGQYNPPQSNSFSTPNANTGLMTGRFGIDTAMTTGISLNVGDTVEYDFFVTSETRNLTGNNPDTWFGDTGTGFQNGSGGWITDRNMRFYDSRWEDYFVSPAAATDGYVYQPRTTNQATHIKWVFTSLTTATVTLTLAGDSAPYATWTNTFSNIADIRAFRVGLYDSEQDTTLANFTVTPSTNPPPSVLVFSGRSWTPLISVASAQYSPPQTNHYAASNPNTGLMTGRFGVDTAMTTPVTLAVGDKVSYDYFLTEESRNFRSTGASTYVGDSRTGFQDVSGNWVSGRVATYSSRWDQYFEGNNPQSVSHARGYPWSIHIEWVFDSATTATVTLTLGGETTPFAVWNDTFSNIANIAKFRVGLWDSEQDVVLANFTMAHRTGSITVDHFWHVGEDNQVLPTDSVGFKPFTGGFGTRTVDTSVYARGSTASLKFANADGGDYMNSLSDAIFVPADNWAFEMWVNPTTSDFGYGATLATLGSDTGTAQIGMVGGNWFFGEMNLTYGNNSQAAGAGVWTHLAWVRDGGVNRFFVGGTQIGSNTDSVTNNGRLHLFVKPGGGEVPQGNLDEVRFSTFTAGQFNAADLLVNVVSAVSNHAPIVRSDNPAAFWRLGEASGPTAFDTVGGHDGTYTGTLTYGVAGALPGDLDTAVEFDGSSGYVAAPFSAPLNPQGPFTVEAWVRPNAVPNSSGTPCPISSAQFNGNRSGWQIRERDTGWQFVLYTHSSSSVANDGLANTAHGGVPSTNSWTHLVGVYDGSNTYLYVNGVAFSSSASGYVANYDDSVNAPGPFTIGARSSLNNNFSGRVDEAVFYSRALSAAEVTSHYLDRPRLTLTSSGGNIVLTWPVGTLQQADEVNGTYTNLSGVTPPYTNSATAIKKFYRLKL